jgi:CheY-like chemotaxis protein
MLSASRSKTTVLVVEDDAVTRELVAQLLQTGGYDVIAVGAGEHALLILCEMGTEIDWLISKRCLPGLVCGSILADEYHEHHPGRPVLLVSQRDSVNPPLLATAILIPQGDPMRALEVLQALKDPELARMRQFPGTRAA